MPLLIFLFDIRKQKELFRSLLNLHICHAFWIVIARNVKFSDSRYCRSVIKELQVLVVQICPLTKKVITAKYSMERLNRVECLFLWGSTFCLLLVLSLVECWILMFVSPIKYAHFDTLLDASEVGINSVITIIYIVFDTPMWCHLLHTPWQGAN
jgi:hypothetical protein